MNWTNRRDLPAPFVAAVTKDTYEKSGEFSVTGLLRPPKMAALQFWYADKITRDVSDAVWILLGRSVHAILELAGDVAGHHIERQLMTTVLGSTVSGRSDVVRIKDEEILDYKVTSVFSFLLGEKPEWTAQLNLLGWLARLHGEKVSRLSIVAILRDWTSSRKWEPDYPEAAALKMPVTVWDDTRCQAFAEERVRLHQAVRKARLEDLPDCTAEERWEHPPSFAVQKPGAKRAFRVYDSAQEAQDNLPDGYEIVRRPGESVRCARFCDARPFCEQGKKLAPEVA